MLAGLTLPADGGVGHRRPRQPRRQAASSTGSRRSRPCRRGSARPSSTTTSPSSPAPGSPAASTGTATSTGTGRPRPQLDGVHVTIPSAFITGTARPREPHEPGRRDGRPRPRPPRQHPRRRGRPLGPAGGSRRGQRRPAHLPRAPSTSEVPDARRCSQGRPDLRERRGARTRPPGSARCSCRSRPAGSAGPTCTSPSTGPTCSPSASRWAACRSWTSGPELDLSQDVYMGHEFSAEVLEVGPGHRRTRGGHDRDVDPDPLHARGRPATDRLQQRGRRPATASACSCRPR